MFLQYRDKASQKWLSNTTKVDLPYSVVGRYAAALSKESTDTKPAAPLSSQDDKIFS